MLKLARRNYSLKIADFEAHSVKTVIKRTKKNEENEKTEKNENDSVNFTRNSMGIQMISNNLYRQIFGSKTSRLGSSFNSETIEKYRKELASHGINDLETPLLPDVELKIPKLSGSNIEEHFYMIAKEQVESYQELVKSIINADIPEMPKVLILFFN